MRSAIVHTPVAEPHRLAVVSKIARVFDYLFGILYALLALRLGLEFFRASKASGVFRLLIELTDPFYAPFKGLFATQTIDGAPVVWPLVAAIVGYVLLHAAIRGLLRLIARA